jgi:1,4-alpha-glucan branching enzyme
MISFDDAADRLASLTLRDPHALLGVHPDGASLVVRCWRPDAVSVDCVLEDGARHPLLQRRPGLFEGRIPQAPLPLRYLLEVAYPGNRVFTVRDAFAFPPMLGDLDLHLFGEGLHARPWDKLGAHPAHCLGVSGVSFAVWAPTASSVSVVGDFNSWDGRLHPMRAMGSSGVWELFVPELSEGARYKFELRPAGGGPRFLKSDPFAFRTEVPPSTHSVVHDPAHFRWTDGAWMERRRDTSAVSRPVSIYEVHPGSWRHVVEDAETGASRPFTWRELAHELGDYATRMGFTHVEFLPVAEHPYGGSWGYQVTGYYAPTARFGHPDDFKYLVDHLHGRGIGVILDWVPGHFPRDAAGLARFDGTALFEHEDPRLGAHPDWGTLIFNLGRNEVRNFLVANALYWLDEYHVDGLRVDAVASMLYLDYSRKPGEWLPNRLGGRENLEAVEFLREVNDKVQLSFPGAFVAAEESTTWPKVSHPTREGGLGFDFKWNMGWMNDTLRYFSRDPIHRQHHHHQLTFGLTYAFSERFILPLSHDEVVHGKGSLLGKMPGDEWRRFANVRALFGWMWAHPGKKLLFMGGEFAQAAEWNHDRSLDWHLLERPAHAGVQGLVAELNRLYAREPALWEIDTSFAGFQWLQADSAELNVLAFYRKGNDGTRPVVCVANLAPVVRQDFALGVPVAGAWEELLNTDDARFGGSGVTSAPLHASLDERDGQPATVVLTLPPLAVRWLAPAR